MGVVVVVVLGGVGFRSALIGGGVAVFFRPLKRTLGGGLETAKRFMQTATHKRPLLPACKAVLNLCKQTVFLYRSAFRARSDFVPCRRLDAKPGQEGSR